MGLRDDILKQPVSALELRELISVSPQTTVREAIAKMREKHLGCVVIVDGQGRPQGKFTERVLVRILLDDPEALGRPVSQYMASVWDQVKVTEPIAEVVDRMQSKGLRFVVVVDGQGKAVALTGQKGVMEYIADHFPRQVKVQRMRSVLYMTEREGA